MAGVQVTATDSTASRRVAFAAVDPKDLQARIAEFPRWHYAFEFEGGVSTPVADGIMLNRHAQRRRYFFEPLLALMGGSLRGQRVLDLGCNAGFWSLNAVEAGADFVLGLDAQQSYLDQASLVFEAKGIDAARFRFERGNVFEHDFAEGFDLILCLGLLDHVHKPVELFEVMSGVGAELLLIDTAISRARSSLFELSSPYSTRDMVGPPLVLVPSRSAVVELASQFGFKTVALELNISDYSGMGDYRRGRRLAFVCSKSLPLDRLAAEKDQSIVPWWVRDPRALRAV
jgi:SAM-dependent methyltransferase